MNCKEFHSYFEKFAGYELENATSSAAAAEHLVVCVDCQQFVDRESDLRKSLQSVRAAVPQVPAALDTSVLKYYRQHIQQSRAAASFRQGMRAPMIIRWGFGFAGAVLIAAVALVLPRRTTTMSTAPRMVKPGLVTPAQSRNGDIYSRGQATSLKRKAVARPSHRTAMSTTASAGDSIPAEFGSVMYCDQLSCAGAMDIIRVQLAAPTPPASFADRGNEPVYADVLVGADGIARGIRIEQ